MIKEKDQGYDFPCNLNVFHAMVHDFPLDGLCIVKELLHLTRSDILEINVLFFVSQIISQYVSLRGTQ